MKISYCVTVFNELEELTKLLNHLRDNKRSEDEIIVLWDSNGPEEVWDYLNQQGEIKLYSDKFQGHFSDWKNKFFEWSKSDFLFFIDADEIPNKYLINNLYFILSNNLENEVYIVPRENFVEGITQEHIEKWRWRIDEKNRINYPDHQLRICKNSPNIRWVNKVHERLTGYKTYSFFPSEEVFSLLHNKEISRQEKQNNYYNSL
jgi:hypothetical protein